MIWIVKEGRLRCLTIWISSGESSSSTRPSSHKLTGFSKTSDTLFSTQQKADNARSFFYIFKSIVLYKSTSKHLWSRVSSKAFNMYSTQILLLNLWIRLTNLSRLKTAVSVGYPSHSSPLPVLSLGKSRGVPTPAKVYILSSVWNIFPGRCYCPPEGFLTRCPNYLRKLFSMQRSCSSTLSKMSLLFTLSVQAWAYTWISFFQSLNETHNSAS